MCHHNPFYHKVAKIAPHPCTPPLPTSLSHQCTWRRGLPNPHTPLPPNSPPPPPTPSNSLTLLSATGVPLSLETLTLLKWKDAQGNVHRFYLINKTAAEWRNFGIRFGQKDELKGWEDEFHRNAKRCWREVMSRWLDNAGTGEYPATWGGVLSVLEDVELWEVARELERVLGSQIVHPPVQPSDTPIPADHFPTTVPIFPMLSPSLHHLALTPPQYCPGFGLVQWLSHPLFPRNLMSHNQEHPNLQSPSPSPSLPCSPSPPPSP